MMILLFAKYTEPTTECHINRYYIIIITPPPSLVELCMYIYDEIIISINMKENGILKGN